VSDRKAAERAAFERVFYPDSRVLVNELGLRDAASLDAAERLFTDTRIEEGMPARASEPTYAGFKAIHHHLFQDLYAWAGQERTYTTGRGPIPFAPPEQIGPWMEKQFAAFRAAGELKGLGAEAFAAKAAEFITEINAAHPFIEGNGRAQRVWLGGVAERAGFEFTIRPEDQAAWYEASRIGFEAANTAPMAQLILARIQTLQLAENGRGPERAAQFLAMSREAALASGDGSFQAAWANLDKIAAVVGSAMAHDGEAQVRLLDKARHQVAEHLRAGRTIIEVSKEQAWRNAAQDQVSSPTDPTLDDRDR
jgi:fido (protein-threonine AMPylation protein)